jgi:hypothetical protein
MAFLGLAMAADTSPVFAQQIRSMAERRQHPGGGFWANDSASRRISHAQDYSRGLQRYSQYIAQPAQPAGQDSNVIVYPNYEIVTTHVRDVGNNIAGAQERWLEVKADATAIKDQATLDSLKSLKDQLASAAAEQKKCMEECKSGKKDMAAIMKLARQ